MSGAESLNRKKRKLIIGSDEEDSEPAPIQHKSEPLPVVPADQPKKSEQPPQVEQQPKPLPKEAPKPSKDLNGKSDKPILTDRNGSFAKDKLARKDEERVQSTISKQTIESDGHASDDDLFVPDDSNTADLEQIRQANNWKKKKVIPPPIHTPLAQKTLDRPPVRAPVQKAPVLTKREAPSKKPKDALIYDVLKRWWYALPDWPPLNHDYTQALESNNLRVVSKAKFRFAQDADEKGLAKCYEVVGFTGVFKDKNNKTYDLRPLENKPCYTNFARKDTSELIDLLKIALKNQIESLESSKVIDESLLFSLKNQYAKVKDR